MFPKDMKKVQDKSGVKKIVMIHLQNFADPEHYNRLGVRDEPVPFTENWKIRFNIIPVMPSLVKRPLFD